MGYIFQEIVVPETLCGYIRTAATNVGSAMSPDENMTTTSGSPPKTTVVLAVLVTALLARIVVAVARWMRMYWYLRNVPHPEQRWPFSLVIDMWQSLSKMDPNLEVTAKIFNYFTGMFKTIYDQEVTVAYYGPQPFLIATTPKSIESILTNGQNLNKAFLYEMMKPWIGNGILMIEKSKWRSRRKVLTPAFHFRVLDDYAPIMNRRAREMISRLDTMGTDFFDVLPVVRFVAFGILFETALGVQIDEAEVQRMRLLEINDEIGASVIARMMNLLHWSDIIYSMTQASRDFRKNINFIHEYNRKIVKQRLSEYKMGKVKADSKKSFLDILLHMHMVDGTLTEDEVKNEVTSIFIGGFETTAVSIAYTLFLLGNHPEVQAKVHEEIDAIFAEDMERDVTVEDIKQMKYLECVVKESMRLYPPVPLIARDVDEDMKVGEYTVPRGSVAVAAIYFIQRHPRYYENPDIFQPERFFDTKEKNPFLYIPFSGGFRNCIGQKFANLEDKILLTQIMRRYTVTSKLRMDQLQLSLEVVLKAIQGLEIKIRPRNRTMKGD
ncbi:cytochrome P450 4V2 isoform X1 [Rhipicephalus sanguineus]|uniref:cytochrome P450 4V2 isoform X1 n=1 Tax=Rhipicephalus sanguineus TaxID=34632 RepID=UPI00189616B2|nr:cytochrome P450 4V2 isoform X1 [Rhipicephalus sanguineus]